MMRYLTCWLFAVCLGVAHVGAAPPVIEPVEKVQWPVHIIDGTGDGADGVRTGDVNGDGLPDIVTGWEESGFTRLYLNPGHERASEPWPYVQFDNTPGVEDAFLADLDDDGRLDVVVCMQHGDAVRVKVFWCPQEPGQLLDASAWEETGIGAAGRRAYLYGQALQLDGNHGVDLFLGGSEVGWLQAPSNPRDGDAWVWHKLQPAQFVRCIEMWDMDGDGHMDFVVNDTPSMKWRRTNPVANRERMNLYWLKNPGHDQATDPAAWKRHDIAPFVYMFFSMGDIDGDGRVEIVHGSDTKFVLAQEGDVWREVAALAPDVGKARSTNLADIDGDGHLEAVCMGVPHHIWHLNGSVQPADWSLMLITNTRGSKPDRSVIFDVDGDGDLDIISCEENYRGAGLGVFWHENPR